MNKIDRWAHKSLSVFFTHQESDQIREKRQYVESDRRWRRSRYGIWRNSELVDRFVRANRAAADDYLAAHCVFPPPFWPNWITRNFVVTIFRLTLNDRLIYFVFGISTPSLYLSALAISRFPRWIGLSFFSITRSRCIYSIQVLGGDCTNSEEQLVTVLSSEFLE